LTGFFNNYLAFVRLYDFIKYVHLFSVNQLRMKKVYYLKTCDTSRRIIKELDELLNDFEFQEIKEQPLEVSQLEEMRERSGSYEKIFSKRAKKYKEMGLKDMSLTEEDFTYYLLQHYTFLKRPVIIIGDHLFAGSNKKDLNKLRQILKDEKEK